MVPQFQRRPRAPTQDWTALKAELIESQKHKTEILKAWVESDKDTLFAPECSIDVARKVVSTKFNWGFPGQATLLTREKLANANIAWECESFSSFKATCGPQHESSMTYIETLIEGNNIPKVQNTVTL